MFVEVISDDRVLKDFCYEPLKSGGIYEATFENKYYMKVFFFINDEEWIACRNFTVTGTTLS
jgi:hypothetical protein